MQKPEAGTQFGECHNYSVDTYALIGCKSGEPLILTGKVAYSPDVTRIGEPAPELVGL
jgi:hypothetical protein